MTIQVLHQRTDLHLARRFWHFGGVFAMFSLYWFLSKNQAIKVALTMSVVLIGLDLLRLALPKLNQILVPLFKPVLREHETKNLTAATYLLIGVTIAIVLYSKTIVLLMLAMLSLADPIAAIVGTKIGKDRLIGGKTLQGSIAAFIVCTLVGLTFFVALNMFSDRLVLISLLCGLIGSLSELIPIAKLDDNLTFPILCSSALAGLFYLYGVPYVF